MNDLIDRQKVVADVVRCENCGHRVAERPFEIYCNIMCKWVDEKDCCTMFEPGREKMRKNGGGDDGNG